MSRLFGPMRQVGIVVRDIEKAMRHWVEVCGIGPWFYAEQLPLSEFRYKGRVYDIKMSVALANSGEVQLELIQQRCDSPSLYRDFLAGGIGAIYGASLAKAGADVTFVARGAHLAATRERGLKIEGDRGEMHISPAQATDDPSDIGPVDIVLFCVKLWDVESAGAGIRPMIGPKTAVIPLQNGVDAHERLIPVLGREAVMGGTAFVTGSIVAPGIVRQTGTYQRMPFGELD